MGGPLRFLPIVLASVRRQRIRSTITIVAISFAFVLFAALSALRSALSFGLSFADEARLRVSNRISIIETLPMRHHREIQQLTNVAAVSGHTWFGGMYQEPRNFFMSLAVTPADFLAMTTGVVLERPVADRWMSRLDGAIAGRDLMERFGWQVGDRVTLDAQFHPRRDGTRTWSFTLLGSYTVEDATYSNNHFLLRQDYLNTARVEPSGVSWFSVRLTDATKASETADSIDSLFRNSTAPTRTQPEGAAAATFARQFADFGSVFSAILAVVFGIIVLVASSTVAESVQERIPEFALLKAVGFSPRQISGLILGESAAIIGIGASAGLLVGTAVVSFARESLADLFPAFTLDLDDYIVGIAIASGLTLLVTLPAVIHLRLASVRSLTAE